MWPVLTLPRTQTLPIGLHLTPGLATLVQFRVRGERLELQALAQGNVNVNESAPSAEQDRDLAALLRRLVAAHGFRGRKVVSCLGSQHLLIQNLRLPTLPQGEAERQMQLEIEERLPYPAADAEVRTLVAGNVRQDGDLKQEILLLVCHRGLLQRHVQVLEMAGLSPQAVDIEPLALLRALAPADLPETSRDEDGEEPKSGIQLPRRAYLILGERTTAVMMAIGQHLLFLKYLPTGSQHLDEAVARHLILSPAVASQTRSLVTTSPQVDLQNDVHRAVMDATRPPMDALCTEIELCLRYFKVTFRGESLDSLVLAGPDATGWMADYMQRRLGLPTIVGDPFAGRCPTTETARDRPGRWAVACGLSMKRWDRLAGS